MFRPRYILFSLHKHVYFKFVSSTPHYLLSYLGDKKTHLIFVLFFFFSMA